MAFGCNGAAVSEPTAGLTAQEIMGRAADAGDTVRSVQTVRTEQFEFLGETSETVTETVISGETVYLTGLSSELLRYMGSWYERDEAGDPWVESAELADVYQSLPDLLDTVTDALSISSNELTRLEDETADGMRMLRVRLTTSVLIDEGHPFLEPLLELPSGFPPLPDELLPDHAEVTLEFWVGADDFHLRRWRQESTASREGTTIFRGTTTTEASGFNEPVTLPEPLPE